MDDSGHRENGRHVIDQYKPVHSQWMMPHHQLKENPNVRMLINDRDKALQERDRAIQERDLALAEKKTTLVERDMLRLQRDAAIAERNNAILERDNAIAALESARENGINVNYGPGCPSARGTKHVSHNQQQHLQLLHPRPQQMSDVSYNQTRETQAEAFPLSVQKTKRSRKETKVQPSSSKRPSKSPRKRKKSGAENLNTRTGEVGVGEDLNKQTIFLKSNEWNSQDLGLNQVAFDDSAMPAPVCSCTGKYQQCYKWGSGGWQSACCTMTLSMYPLPVMPNKRHARLAGRKMSGSAFRKLLSRLASEGHDLSLPVDLKDCWSKHGTNRYITIK